MSPNRKLNVFVSSTSEDLREYRAVSSFVILDMGWVPKMMEHFGAMPQPTFEACKEKLSQCDLVLLIVAFRRGWVPTLEQGGNGVDSITALELSLARKSNIPVLAMLASETWPGNLWEDDPKAREWVKKFRSELNLPAVFFNNEPVSAGDSERLPAFRAKVKEALLSHRERELAKEAAGLGGGQGAEYFEIAKDGLINGSSIPFIGPGVYGESPLSIQSLSRALGGEECGEHSCLATAAEYRERRLGSRDLFMKEFCRLIQKHVQSWAEDLPAVHQMILRVEPPPLIVSTTYDLILENRLEKEGKSYVLLCHIVRSFEGKDDGKILVLRKGEEPKTCLADKIDLGETNYVIYKPLGSPLLQRSFDVDSEIDSVVITETDHLTFLGRLEHEHTKIPAEFSRPFQLYPLLFLGYTLDVWHYRLVMQVFESIGLRKGHASSRAVRIPASRMEALAWHRLGTDLIPMDSDAFAKRVCEILK